MAPHWPAPPKVISSAAPDRRECNMRLTVIIAALCLGACATTPAMDTALAPLTGQPVQLVLDQLGPPSSSTPAGTDTIYQWYSTKMVHGTPSSRFNGSASA